MGDNRYQTANVTSKVIQGHSQCCHYIGRIRFHISVPFQLCLYLAPVTRYYYLFAISLSTITYYSCTSSPLYQSAHGICSAQFHQLQRYDWVQNLRKLVRDLDHINYGVVCHLKPSTWYILPAYKFVDSHFNHSRDMIVGIKTENGSCDPDHAL